jgi:guanylate kinase
MVPEGAIHMHNVDELGPLLQLFAAEDRQTLIAHIERYDELLQRLLEDERSVDELAGQTSGIFALNGASGAGQSYVLARVEKLLNERSIALPRIHLLATRSPRPGEGHKQPYIFVVETDGEFQDIHHPDVIYRQDDIYFYYQSRPGAGNAILYDDVRAAMQKTMYLETVIPTLLHMKTTKIGDVPAWRDRLKIVYLATPSGQEWLYRLLNREPSKLENEEYRAAIVGRVVSSIEDMEQAVEHQVPTVLNRHEQGEQAAREILSVWAL